MGDIVKSYTPRAADIQHAWHLIDATDRPLGRLASEIAVLLHGKHKAIFAPHADVGDYVVVINAAHVGITGGNKREQKMYYRHSGYPGGLKSVSLEQLMAKSPERVIEYAVHGMLPKNSLGRQMYRKLRVYAGPSHPHIGQFRASEVRSEDD